MTTSGNAAEIPGRAGSTLDDASDVRSGTLAKVLSANVAPSLFIFAALVRTWVALLFFFDSPAAITRRIKAESSSDPFLDEGFF